MKLFFSVAPGSRQERRTGLELALPPASPPWSVRPHTAVPHSVPLSLCVCVCVCACLKLCSKGWKNGHAARFPGDTQSMTAGARSYRPAASAGKMEAQTITLDHLNIERQCERDPSCPSKVLQRDTCRGGQREGRREGSNRFQESHGMCPNMAWNIPWGKLWQSSRFKSVRLSGWAAEVFRFPL